MRAYLLICVLLTAWSCGRSRPESKIQLGQSTRAQVVEEKGEEGKEEKIPVKDAVSVSFSDGDRIQFKNDIAVVRFSEAVGDEKSLLWWKHKFKDCATTTTTLEHVKHAHVLPEKEFKCASEGLSIIFYEGSDVVVRVVEIEKK